MQNLRGRTADEVRRIREREAPYVFLNTRLDEGVHELMFDIEVTVSFPAAQGVCAREVKRAGRVTRVITIVDENALRPVDTPELSRAISDSVNWVVRQSGAEPPELCLRVRVSDELADLRRNIEVPVVVELLNADRAVVYQRKVDLTELSPMKDVALVATGQSHRVPQSDDYSGWLLRVRGDEPEALTNLRSDTYWNGAVTIPMRFD